jgi:hemerythrin-like metal-binding protein
MENAESTEQAVQFIVWNDSVSVGIAEIDAQHRQILDTINELYNMFNDGTPKSKLLIILTRLKDYTKTHFAAEEALMEKSNYPDIENHKALHHKMSAKTMLFDSRSVGNANSLSHEVFNFLKDWWIAHIRGMDTRYVPYITE